MWNKNVGSIDAKIRVTTGMLLLLLLPLKIIGYIPITILSSTSLATVGIVLVLEGVFERCILYSILGINRCPTNINQPEDKE